MHPLPHRYQVQARAAAVGNVEVRSAGLESLDTSAPPEFDGPEGFWSPETMLAGAVANCYILSFRAVARASKLEWEQLAVDVEGVLDRVEGTTRFTRFVIRVRLGLCSDADLGRAPAVLDKAKRVCLVTNSLTAEVELETDVSLAQAAGCCP